MLPLEIHIFYKTILGAFDIIFLDLTVKSLLEKSFYENIW